MIVLGPHAKDRKYSSDKSNIGYPKVNKDCPPLTANRTSVDCVQISPGPSVQHIPLWVCHTGGFNAMDTLWFLNKNKHHYVAFTEILCERAESHGLF